MLCPPCRSPHRPKRSIAWRLLLCLLHQIALLLEFVCVCVRLSFPGSIFQWQTSGTAFLVQELTSRVGGVFLANPVATHDSFGGRHESRRCCCNEMMALLAKPAHHSFPVQPVQRIPARWRPRPAFKGRQMDGCHVRPWQKQDTTWTTWHAGIRVDAVRFVCPSRALYVYCLVSVPALGLLYGLLTGSGGEREGGVAKKETQ